MCTRRTVLLTLVAELAPVVAGLATEPYSMDLSSPPATCRPAPFWSWNDTLDDAELRWQVQQMHAAGFGGFFMHPRVGLETPYLSDEWFERIRTCVDEARKLGMEAWLYDEDKWPSGFAGGLVLRRHPEAIGVGLIGEDIAPADLPKKMAEPGRLAVFMIRRDADRRVVEWRRLKPGETPKPDEPLFGYRVAPYIKDNWFNGETYIDVLSPPAVDHFLQITMDGYAKRFRDDFGHTIPGIFTDEPNFNPHIGHAHAIPWTPAMAERFRARFGYDLTDQLAALAAHTPGYQKVRYDYHRMLTEMFVEAFSKPYGELCGKLGLSLTGHWLWEDTLGAQTAHIGAAMPHYEYEQVPGIDHLRRNIEDPLTLKQCSSVAHQFGRERVLCEIYGVSGQDFTFEDAKWIADFHLALGVNYFCPHLTLYSMTGDRKRDYPPTFSYHQPYWSHMPVIHDYLARGGMVVRRGQATCPILVLHPIGTAWALFSRFEPCPEVDHYHNEFIKLQDTLLGGHRDFDYGDEIILSRHGRVDGRQFRVASHGRYDAVIVPPSYTWAAETVAQMEAFAAAGGRLIFVGDTPQAINAEPADERWAKLLACDGVVRCNNDAPAVLAALDQALPREVSVAGPDGKEITSVLYNHRRDGDTDVYFFANTDRAQSFDARISLRATGGVFVCDLATGRATPQAVTTQDGMTMLEHRFAPVGSLAVFVDPAASAPKSTTAPAAGRSAETRRQPLPNSWDFRRTHPNSLVLDVCRYSLNDAPPSEPTPVWKVRHAAFDAAGLGQYRGLQPWVLAERGIRPDKTVHVAMHFEFASDLDGPQAALVVEHGKYYSIELNGASINAAGDGWHWDKRFTRIPLGDRIRKGTNRLVLVTEYRPGVEIEDVFVVGDFATRQIDDTHYAITAEPARLATGDWGPQGYHFYAGNMVYRARVTHRPEPGGRTMLRLVQPHGTMFDAIVNGRPVGSTAWQPWELDVTDAIRDGTNDIEITVYGSLRNSFGPLHNTNYASHGNNWWIGPNAFTDEQHWTDKYTLSPYGLLGGAELVTVAAP